jgi:hypothetical protein
MHMTAREFLNRRRRLLAVVASVGMAMFGVGMIVEDHLGPGRPIDAVRVMCFSGFILFVITLVYTGFFAIRCPWCRSNLSNLVINRTSSPRSNRIVRFCPFCGEEFDKQLPSVETTNQADSVTM